VATAIKSRSISAGWGELSQRRQNVRFVILILLAFLFLSIVQRTSLADGGPGDVISTPEGMVDRFVDVEKLKVHYVSGGRGAQTVVMIHGNAGCLQDFEYGVIKLLAGKYRVLAFDRPGHGKSERPGSRAASVEYQATLLHKTLASLRVTDPILVGHSWGSSLALAYAMKYPGETAGLVLLAPAAYPDDDPNPILRGLVGLPVLGDASLYFGKALMGSDVLKHDLEEAFSPQPVPENYLKVATSTFLGRKQLRAYLEDEWSLNASLRRMSKHYSEIKAPVAIVTGDSDQIVSAKDNAYRLQKEIAGSKLLELPNTGHEIPVTRPESVSIALDMVTETLAGAMVAKR
jgi:pimeloyl-ACP methyl ester carboxylesterase